MPAEISLNQGRQSGQLRLQPYQIVQATVEEGGLERVVLNVREHRLRAETRVPLRTGQKLNLQVLGTSPRVHLRIMEEAELRHLFRLLHSFGKNVRLMPLLEHLGSRGGPVLQGLVRLLKADPGAVTGNDLSSLWSGLGLDLEALLAAGRKEQAARGLKAFLLMRPGPGDAAGVLEQLHLFQLCRYRLAQENVMFLPLPFAFLEQGYLLAEREDREPETGEGREEKKEAGTATWKMTLHLNLSALGNVEIRLLFEGRVLRMRVLCENEKRAQSVCRAMPELRKRLTTVELRGFSTGTGAGDPVMNLLRRLVPEGDHFLEAEA